MTTPISLRIDIDNLEALDKMSEQTWRKRNRLINDAIRAYVKLEKLNDLYRMQRLMGDDRKDVFCKEHLRYCHRELPEFLRQWG